MPNHIQNRLRFEGSSEAVARVRAHLSREEDGNVYPMDFNKIVPMPAALNMEHVRVDVAKAAEYIMDLNDRNAAWYWDLDKQRGTGPKSYDDAAWGDFIQCLQNLRAHGSSYWYEWAVKHWGTKWNAYDMPSPRDTADTIHFQTAWSAPRDLMQKLSAAFPDVTVYLEYADEDLGRNAGRYAWRGGEQISGENLGNGSAAARRFAWDVFGHNTDPETLRDYGMDENFEYVPDEDEAPA